MRNAQKSGLSRLNKPIYTSICIKIDLSSTAASLEFEERERKRGKKNQLRRKNSRKPNPIRMIQYSTMTRVVLKASDKFKSKWKNIIIIILYQATYTSEIKLS